MSTSEQLLLNLRPRPDARLSDFAAPAYEELLMAARRVLAEPGGLLYVHGEPGQGRSHLMAALCGEAERQGLSALLLPLTELGREDAALLGGLEGQGLIAFDDVEAIAGNAAWEEALFHLFNRARADATTRLVFSAALPPSRCGFQLPDLASRLAQAPAWMLALPDDDSRQALLEQAARRRDLAMEEGVMRYLVARGPREPGRLLAMVALLDHRSLMAGRRLTIPFVRQILESPEASAKGFSL